MQSILYIKGYSNYTYLLTYVTSDTKSKSLLDLCSLYPNSYFMKQCKERKVERINILK